MRPAAAIVLYLLAACSGGEPAARDANRSGGSGSEANAAAAEAEARRFETQSGGSAQRWFARQRAEGGWAGYGPPYSEAAFSARCEAGAGQLVLSTTEMPPDGPGTTVLHVSAAGIDRDVPAEASEEGLPNTDAPVPADADWLQQLASADGDLTVRVGGSDPLVVPIGEPLRELIRDCAGSGAAGPATARASR